MDAGGGVDGVQVVRASAGEAKVFIRELATVGAERLVVVALVNQTIDIYGFWWHTVLLLVKEHKAVVYLVVKDLPD